MTQQQILLDKNEEFGPIESIGIMTYSNEKSLQAVHNYANATSTDDGVTVNVPTQYIQVGLQGGAQSSTIIDMANSQENFGIFEKLRNFWRKFGILEKSGNIWKNLEYLKSQEISGKIYICGNIRKYLWKYLEISGILRNTMTPHTNTLPDLLWI
eukprot:277634_1